MGKELFSRYVWLLETIHRAGKITFEEINARWLRSELSGGETLHPYFSSSSGCDRRAV